MKASAARFLPAVLALAMVACASDGTPQAAASSATVAPDDPARALLAAGYKRVTVEGEEYFCRQERITGTRARTREVCLTPADLARRQQDGDDFLRRSQDQGAVQPPSSLPAPGSPL